MKTRFIDRFMRAAVRPVGRAVAVVVAVVAMLLALWYADRTSYSDGSDTMNMKLLHIGSILVGRGDTPMPADYLPINIGYDRELVDVADQYGMPLGNLDVTDRAKLLRFAEALDAADYRALVIDVFFDAALPAPGDTVLLRQLSKMPNVVLPQHRDAELSPLVPVEMTAIGDYSTDALENNFVKYPFVWHDEGVSLAERVSEICGGHRSWRDMTTMILPIDIRISEQYDADGNQNWYNLGCDVLDVYTPDEIRRLANNRIIVVGDYSGGDMHDTYAGPISGPVIIINAIDAANRGILPVHPLEVLSFVALFLLIAWLSIYNRSWRLRLTIPAARRVVSFIGFLLPFRRGVMRHFGTLVRWIAGFLSYATLIVILQLTIYWMCGRIHDISLVAALLIVITFYSQKINSNHSQS